MKWVPRLVRDRLGVCGYRIEQALEAADRTVDHLRGDPNAAPVSAETAFEAHR